MISLSYPFTQEKICALKVGDEVLISDAEFPRREHGFAKWRKMEFNFHHANVGKN